MGGGALKGALGSGAAFDLGVVVLSVQSAMYLAAT